MRDKLLIIQPSYYLSKRDRTVHRLRRRPVVPLSSCYLAALTPDDWEVTLVDEQLQPIDFDCRPDLVASRRGLSTRCGPTILRTNSGGAASRWS